MAIKKDTLDQLLDGRDPKEVFNKDGLFDELKKALAERVLNAELDDHLESEAPAGVQADGTNDILGLWIENTGRQVLAARHERTQEPGRRRHSHRRCRWPGGASAG